MMKVFFRMNILASWTLKPPLMYVRICGLNSRIWGIECALFDWHLSWKCLVQESMKKAHSLVGIKKSLSIKSYFVDFNVDKFDFSGLVSAILLRILNTSPKHIDRLFECSSIVRSHFGSALLNNYVNKLDIVPATQILRQFTNQTLKKFSRNRLKLIKIAEEGKIVFLFLKNATIANLLNFILIFHFIVQILESFGQIIHYLSHDSISINTMHGHSNNHIGS